MSFEGNINGKQPLLREKGKLVETNFPLMPPRTLLLQVLCQLC